MTYVSLDTLYITPAPLGGCESEIVDSGISANGDFLPTRCLKGTKERVKLNGANPSLTLEKNSSKLGWTHGAWAAACFVCNKEHSCNPVLRDPIITTKLSA